MFNRLKHSLLNLVKDADHWQNKRKLTATIWDRYGQNLRRTRWGSFWVISIAGVIASVGGLSVSSIPIL